jgi:hypothetical protein
MLCETPGQLCKTPHPSGVKKNNHHKLRFIRNVSILPFYLSGAIFNPFLIPSMIDSLIPGIELSQQPPKVVA